MDFYTTIYSNFHRKYQSILQVHCKAVHKYIKNGKCGKKKITEIFLCQ